MLRLTVQALAGPLGIAFLIGLIAALCRALLLPRTARCLAISGLLIAYLGSVTAVGDVLLESLERQVPPLVVDAPPAPANYVVVLGSGYAPRDHVPITGALDADGLARIVEGVRLMRQLEVSELIVSGGARGQLVSPAQGYARLARELGVDAARVKLLDSGIDTAAEARAIVGLLGKTPFILVTSAYHMPRALQVMWRAGGRPVPAPTGQLVDVPSANHLRNWLPSSSGLRKSERALHEYLGLAALKAGLD